MTREGRQFTLPAFEVAVRDTSGCGDSYTGGFIAGLVRDWDLLDCAKLATATAAIVATGLGSGANLVSFEDTIHAMNAPAVRGAGRPYRLVAHDRLSTRSIQQRMSAKATSEFPSTLEFVFHTRL
jgi:bifunctional ADP-heptose synthase (sugar kinase/adenylyltransferase)